MDEQAFLDAIAANPRDVHQRLVFADWLEEQGDPRCEAVRRQCRMRMPFSQADVAQVSAIARARETADGSRVEFDMRIAVDLPHRSRNVGSIIRRAERIVEFVDSRRLERYFPRNDRGELQPNTRVLLAALRHQDELTRARQLFLMACTPVLPVDPTITVCIHPLFGRSEYHDWRSQAWRWDRRVDNGNDLTAAGYDAETAELATFDNRRGRIAELTSNDRRDTLDRWQAIALATLLLDEARFEEAFQVCGVETSPQVSRCLDGLPVGQQVSRWQVEQFGVPLRRLLWETAPWAFAQALDNEQRRLQKWLLSVPGHRYEPVQVFLKDFPDVASKSRRRLTLVYSNSGAPRLEFHVSDLGRKTFDRTWRRPVEFDIARMHACRP